MHIISFEAMPTRMVDDKSIVLNIVAWSHTGTYCLKIRYIRAVILVFQVPKLVLTIVRALLILRRCLIGHWPNNVI